MDINAFVNDLAARIRARRDELDLTQFDVAARADVSYATVQRAERIDRLANNEDMIGLRSLFDIAAALDCDLVIELRPHVAGKRKAKK